MACITDLPIELLLQILMYLTQRRDLCSLSLCNRSVHWWVASQLFNNAFKQRSERRRPELVFMDLVLHAIKHDSQNIVQWLVCHELRSKLNGLVPMFGLKNITYLHLSIIGDAPRVAAYLVKHGTDIRGGEGDYPDLTPLCLAVARPQDAPDLDGPLRIACSYAFPRISRYLLARGADPNKLSRFGLAAIHLAVMKRLPWRNFGLLPLFLGLENGVSVYDDISVRWKLMLLRTVFILLWFGGDPNLPSATSRVHSCRHQCWRSPDCSHRGQRVLHFACGNGEDKVVKILLKHGADPTAADNEGYLPLFFAICQDHNSLALRLLQNTANPATLIVVQPHRSTALHIACRFASVEVVIYLLKRGADTNGTDEFGQTPLHEVMAQNSWKLEARVLETLHHLARNGALPDLRVKEGKTAREMAAQHLFSRVRELFDFVGSEYPALEHDHDLPSETNGRVAGSSVASRQSAPQGAVEASDNRVSFPDLGSRSPKHTTSFNSVWHNEAKTKQLFRKVHERWLAGEINPKVVRDGGRERSNATKSVEEVQTLNSANFWSSFSFQTQENSQRGVQSTCERQTGATEGVSRRRKRKQQWSILELP